MAVHTLGCKVNQYDSEALAGLFRRSGYRVVDFSAPADVYIINTCTVTSESDRKSRQLIRRARRRNPEAVVVVAGCYSQVAPGEVAAIPGVDVVVGNADRARLVELVEAARAARAETGAMPLVAVDNIFRVRDFEELPIAGFTGRTRAVVKIQEGCNEMCTYCIIPFARGRPRSRRPEEVRAEVERLAAAGFREVVLTGIHLGAYGRDLPDRPALADALRAVHEVAGIARIRLSSLEPMDVGADLLDAIAGLPRVCPHLHLPLQSGSDAVLRRMRRRYTVDDFRTLVRAARARIPDLVVTTDVIAGFPGETEEDHAATLSFLKEIGFSRLHVFPYSPREGTPAASYPDQVPPAVRERRAREVAALGERLALEYHRRLVGHVVEVLVEAEASASGGVSPETARGEDFLLLEGYTPQYVRVRFPGGEELRNGLVRVRVTAAGSAGVLGYLKRGDSTLNHEQR